MMVPLFEPGGLRQAQYALLPLSAAALVVIGVWNWRLLAPAGIAWAGVGAFAASAIFVNRSALNLGQFTIICMGLIALQMTLLQRNRMTLAGACWALAMIKPHIAMPFAALFLINRQWRGLVLRVAILLALSSVHSGGLMCRSRPSPDDGYRRCPSISCLRRSGSVQATSPSGLG
jgi:hypothetical protein